MCFYFRQRGKHRYYAQEKNLLALLLILRVSRRILPSRGETERHRAVKQEDAKKKKKRRRRERIEDDRRTLGDDEEAKKREVCKVLTDRNTHMTSK